MIEDGLGQFGILLFEMGVADLEIDEAAFHGREPYQRFINPCPRLGCLALAALVAIGCRASSRRQPAPPAGQPAAEVVTFPSGNLTLHGVVHRPTGAGPFPAVLYNHGSAPGMMSAQAADALGPLFTARGWVFFMPYRRGQGLSADAGPYIMDEISAARRARGVSGAAATTVRLLIGDHLNDQLAGLAWLRAQSFVQPDRVAVAGNSFGGIEAVLAAEHRGPCAAIDSAGGAASWAKAPELRWLMHKRVRKAQIPILLFQAENDHDLAPSHELAAALKQEGKPFEMKIFPAFGSTAEDGHAFGYFGGAIWANDVFRFLDAHCGGARAAADARP